MTTSQDLLAKLDQKRGEALKAEAKSKLVS